jgi:uncharacterized membrane protein YtjA (UPF0391 family)
METVREFADLIIMFRRAHISAMVALIAATFGFLGFVETTVAQTIFYVFMSFATLSMLLGMFEADRPMRKPRFQPGRLQERS